MINKLKKNYSCTDLYIKNEKNSLKKCYSFIDLGELKKKEEKLKLDIQISLKKIYN